MEKIFLVVRPNKQKKSSDGRGTSPLNFFWPARMHCNLMRGWVYIFHWLKIAQLLDANAFSAFHLDWATFKAPSSSLFGWVVERSVSLLSLKELPGGWRASKIVNSFNFLRPAKTASQLATGKRWQAKLYTITHVFNLTRSYKSMIDF